MLAARSRAPLRVAAVAATERQAEKVVSCSFQLPKGSTITVSVCGCIEVFCLALHSAVAVSVQAATLHSATYLRKHTGTLTDVVATTAFTAARARDLSLFIIDRGTPGGGCAAYRYFVRSGGWAAVAALGGGGRPQLQGRMAPARRSLPAGGHPAVQGPSSADAVQVRTSYAGARLQLHLLA